MQLVVWSCIAVLTAFVFLLAFLGKTLLAILFAVLILVIGFIATRMRLESQKKGKVEVEIVDDDSARKYLRSVDRKGIFDDVIDVIVDGLKSSEVKREFFEEQGLDSSLYSSYQLIHNKMLSLANSAYRYIKFYDYILMPNRTYAVRICESCRTLAGKLSELSDLAMQIDDTSCGVDSSYADDMLKSLQDILEGMEE